MHPIPFACRFSGPPLHRAIAHVVYGRPEEQMRRTDAWRIIAMVENMKAGWNGAIV
jgi:hypothetical protein